jgi:curved DNA-binding protein CbpA
MKLDSKYFDIIRVSRGRGRARAESPQASAPSCQWGNCSKRGLHRAPKGRSNEGEYYYFCREHVTEYNKSYNYFAGMDEDQVTEFQKSAATGHRPTWSMGVRGNGTDAGAWEALRSAKTGAGTAQDPLEILKTIRGSAGAGAKPSEAKKRFVLLGAKKHLNALNLDENATPDEIKVQFKALVKLHHPDHNGGDRSSEERFREVLAAYNYLKQAGLVR